MKKIVVACNIKKQKIENSKQKRNQRELWLNREAQRLNEEE